MTALRISRTAPVLAGVAIALFLSGTAGADEVPVVGPDDIAALVADRRGDVVVVNFWATWCPPCLREFPDIIAAYDDYRDRGVDVLAVSMNEAEEVADIDDFIERFDPPFGIYRAESLEAEFFSGVLDSWYGEMPMTLVFDRTGELVDAHKKPLTYDELAAELDRLLGQSLP